MEKPYILFNDASPYAYSGILTQAVVSPDDLRPIASTPDSFPNMQQRWSTAEKEAFAVYQSLLKFNLCLKGEECTLGCDHKLLEPFCLRTLKCLSLTGGLWNWQTTIKHLYLLKIKTMCL